jgi:purine-binding chemotaxis protein CheW
MEGGSDMAESEKQFVVFNLLDEEFCIDIMSVVEIIRLQDITKLPDAPEFVEGIINLRGKIIPVIDLKKRFNLEKIGTDDNTRIIITNIDNKTTGFIVDNVTEVLRLSADAIAPLDNEVVGIDKDYISGIGKLEKRMLIILDLNKILSKNEKEDLKKIE